MKKLRWGVLLMVWLPCATQAQLSLDGYCRAVEAYSYTLQAARWEAEGLKAEMHYRKSRQLPALNLAGDFSINLRHHSGVKPWDFALQPEVVATLYGKGLKAAYREAALTAQAAESEVEYSRFELRYAATYAYWNLSAMSAYYKATAHYVEIIRSLRQVVADRFEEGYIAKSDLLMLEARLCSAEYDLRTAEEQLKVARHNFNRLRGVDLAEQTQLQESILDTVMLPYRLSAQGVLARRADLQAERLKGEALEERIAQTRRRYLPSLEVGVTAAWQPQSPNTRGKTTLNGVGFGRLSLPIFNGGARRAELHRAEADLQRQEALTADLEQEILCEERNGWSRLEESFAQIEAADRGLQIAGESLDLSTYSYREGLLTLMEVLQAQLDWIQLYTNAITAHFNFAVARADYQRITAQEQ